MSALSLSAHEAPALPDEVVRSGRVRVAAPPNAALELFTARGEVGWAPGWEPRFVSPPDGAPVAGGVWLTAADGKDVIWRVQRFDRAAREAEYLRITPGERLVVVAVRIAADGADSVALVTYRGFALSDAGRSWRDGFSAEAYAGMLREWERLIAAHLSARAA